MQRTVRCAARAGSPGPLPAVKRALDGRGGLFASGDKGLRWLKKAGLARTNPVSVEPSDAQVEATYELYIKAIRRKPEADLNDSC